MCHVPWATFYALFPYIEENIYQSCLPFNYAIIKGFTAYPCCSLIVWISVHERTFFGGIIHHITIAQFQSSRKVLFNDQFKQFLIMDAWHQTYD